SRKSFRIILGRTEGSSNSEAMGAKNLRPISIVNIVVKRFAIISGTVPPNERSRANVLWSENARGPNKFRELSRMATQGHHRIVSNLAPSHIHHDFFLPSLPSHDVKLVVDRLNKHELLDRSEGGSNRRTRFYRLPSGFAVVLLGGGR